MNVHAVPNRIMLNTASSITRTLRLSVTAAAVLVLFGCTQTVPEIFDPSKHDFIDRDLELSRDDYRHPALPRKGDEDALARMEKSMSSGPAIPNVAQILASPQQPKIGEAQLVSIAVTDDVPLKDVLIELARLADVDIELDAGITGGISFRAKDRPFNQVIDRIADLAGLRYTMKDGVLRVERDMPYVKNYEIDFLNMNRSSDANISVNTNVLAAGSSSGNGSGGSGGSSGGGSSSGGSGGSEDSGLNTGSNATVKSQTVSDFWTQLDRGIRQILSFAPSVRLSSPTTLAADGYTNADGTTPAPGAATTAGGLALAPALTPVAAPATATDGAGADSAGGTAEVEPARNKTFFILNRQAGVLTASATDKQHRMIQSYLDKLRVNASAQVLIESKIVEVALNDTYQSGIDWSILGDTLKINSMIGAAAPDFTGDPFGGELISFAINDNIKGHTLDAMIRLAENFGTTRTLSSPRLHAINNQTAVLTFAENRVYFQVQVERETNTSSGTSQNFFNVSSEVRTVPIGIILSIQPSINLEKGEVTLNVHPTLSQQKGTVKDPAVAIALAQAGDNAALDGVENNVPIVEVRELDTILKVRSGQIMVIGGLMKQNSENTDTGVPGASSIPFVGNLFKNTRKTNNMSELIILIKATIVGNRGNVHDADRIIYQKFSDDPRPLSF